MRPAPAPPSLALLERGEASLVLDLAREPGLATEFDFLQSQAAVEDKFGDPFRAPALFRLARVDGEPAGFSLGFRFPGPERGWALARIGVAERFRRRGVGTALVEAALDQLRALPAAEVPRDLVVSAWMPSATAPGFAAGIGFHEARQMWLMERPLDSPPAPEWPDGIEVRTFDGTESALAEWNDAYNLAFADNYRFVLATMEHSRAITRLSSFRAAGLVMAYRDGRCVGFCRDSLDPTRGEVALLGVVPECRGLGLGRALLRAGVRWLVDARAPRVELRVDGENETALRLYRDERFTVARTRTMWARDL